MTTKIKRIQATNDFVVLFANINGSGSASANNLFAKAVFRLGIPVSPKNIFPSNIQGLPTWFEVRISEKGYLGRREGYDFVVATNGQTVVKDYQELATGGYFFYDLYSKYSQLNRSLTLLSEQQRELTNLCQKIATLL